MNGFIVLFTYGDIDVLFMKLFIIGYYPYIMRNFSIHNLIIINVIIYIKYETSIWYMLGIQLMCATKS